MDDNKILVGLGRAMYDSDRIEKEKKSEKQKALVHYDYLYLEKSKTYSE
jgi:glutamate 5-kinase